jgi:chromatin segregation and condensation protein Rec8/ScpA/Scc1 (kleisin family)
LFESAASRSEVVCTFLALLELIRLKQLVCAQPEPFAEIEIRRAATSIAAPAPATEASASSPAPSASQPQ